MSCTLELDSVLFDFQDKLNEVLNNAGIKEKNIFRKYSAMLELLAEEERFSSRHC